jgi:hypothetical protein
MKSYMFPEEEIEKLREKHPTIKKKDKRTPLEPEINQLNLTNILPSLMWKRKISR